MSQWRIHSSVQFSMIVYVHPILIASTYYERASSRHRPCHVVQFSGGDRSRMMMTMIRNLTVDYLPVCQRSWWQVVLGSSSLLPPETRHQQTRYVLRFTQCYMILWMVLYTLHLRKTLPFWLLWQLSQMSSNFANFWQKHTPGNLNHKRVTFLLRHSVNVSWLIDWHYHTPPYNEQIMSFCVARSIQIWTKTSTYKQRRVKQYTNIDPAQDWDSGRLFTSFYDACNRKLSHSNQSNHDISKQGFKHHWM